MTSPGILERIGHTSLLALWHVVPSNGARVLLKLENENPTGSMKDRMAVAMHASSLLVAPPVIEHLDVLGAKLPG